MLDIEMQFGDFIGSAGRKDGQPQPNSKTRLEIHSVSLAGVVRNDKARPSDFGHYLVADPADVILIVDATRSFISVGRPMRMVQFAMMSRAVSWWVYLKTMSYGGRIAAAYGHQVGILPFSSGE